MGNVVATSVVLSCILSAALTAGIAFSVTNGIEEDASSARVGAMNAQIEAASTRRELSERLDGASEGATRALSGLLECSKSIEAMRQELDEMQTQMRLLKLRVP